jgi:hypothetical protein
MATSPRNLTTQESPQGVNEIAQNDLNPPTFQTESNPTPPMDLRQALRNFKNGIYGDMTRDGMVDHILADVYIRVMARETSEQLKDNLCHLWRCGMLREAGLITINGLMEEVDFETGLIEGEEWEGKEWMRRFAEEGSAIDGFACDNADVILKEYGLDEAMEDFYDEYVFQREGDDRPRFDGLRDFLAYHCLRDTVFGFGCVMFEALQPTEPPTPTLEIAKAPKTVGECPLCCDESSVLLTLPCGHAFGTNCLQDWIDTKYRNDEPTTCPMCRAEFEVVVRRSVRHYVEEYMALYGSR